MPSVPKVLGQVSPPASMTVLYTVPTGVVSTIVSTLMACNSATQGAYISVRVAINGVADDPSQAIYNQVYLAPNETFAATMGITMDTSDVIRCASSLSGVSFTLFGTEVS